MQIPHNYISHMVQHQNTIHIEIESWWAILKCDAEIKHCPFGIYSGEDSGP